MHKPVINTVKDIFKNKLSRTIIIFISVMIVFFYLAPHFTKIDPKYLDRYPITTVIIIIVILAAPGIAAAILLGRSIEAIKNQLLGNVPKDKSINNE